MNVWLWGPPMWTIVHGLASKADEDPIFQGPFHVLAKQLRVVLPCVYCRNSQNVFLDDLGMPVPGANLEWSYRMHNKVNDKLEKQRIEKTLAMECFPNKDLAAVLQTSECRDNLFSRPSLEVLRKRAVIQSSNPWTERDILMVCLVLYLHAQGPRDNTVEAYFGKGLTAVHVSPETLTTQNAFVENLAKVHSLLKVHSFAKFLTSLAHANLSVNSKVAKIAKELYPDDTLQERVERVRLFRAGACLNGTCV